MAVACISLDGRIYMHIYACMRTTIELRDDLRVRLVAEAARRGLPGYSQLIEQALEAYLSDGGEDRTVRVRSLRGSLKPSEADAALSAIKRARANWRK